VRYLQATVIGFVVGAISAWGWGRLVGVATRPLTELEDAYPPKGDWYVIDLIRSAGT
jgi:hypothetical protein